MKQLFTLLMLLSFTVTSSMIQRRRLQSTNFDADVKEFFDQMNKVRTEPKSLIPQLKDTIKKFRGKTIGHLTTYEGARAYKELITFLESTTPLSPVTWSNAMGRACQKFVDWAGPKGSLGHDGPGNLTMGDRLDAEGKWSRSIGENLAYGDRDGMDSLIQLLVDDGVASRGHRKNIFNGKFKVVGVAIGKHSRYGFMTCNDFAAGFMATGDDKPKFEWNRKSSSGSKATTQSTNTTTKSPTDTKKPTTNTPSKKPTTKTNTNGTTKRWGDKNKGGWSWSSKGSNGNSGNGDPWKNGFDDSDWRRARALLAKAIES